MVYKRNEDKRAEAHVLIPIYIEKRAELRRHIWQAIGELRLCERFLLIGSSHIKVGIKNSSSVSMS